MTFRSCKSRSFRSRFAKLSALAACGFSLLFVAQLRAEPIIGLTSLNTLVRFDSSSPGTTTVPIAVSGLSANEFIFDIDIRPADGLLYGFSNQGNLYSINIFTGAATLNASLTGVILSGTRFGIDFNPTVDRLRISVTRARICDLPLALRSLPSTQI